MMYKLWILFAAFLISPIAAADCYYINGELACIHALNFNSTLPPTLMDLMDQRAAQQAQTYNLILDAQLKRQQIQMQQQQMEQHQQIQMQGQQDLFQSKLEIIKNSLLKLSQNERDQLSKYTDSLSEGLQENFVDYFSKLSEEDRMRELKSTAIIQAKRK